MQLDEKILHICGELSSPLFPFHGSCLAWLKKNLAQKELNIARGFLFFPDLSLVEGKAQSSFPTDSFHDLLESIIAAGQPVLTVAMSFWEVHANYGAVKTGGSRDSHWVMNTCA